MKNVMTMLVSIRNKLTVYANTAARVSISVLGPHFRNFLGKS